MRALAVGLGAVMMAALLPTGATATTSAEATGLWANTADGRVTLHWQAAPGATFYDVFRDGQYRGKTSATVLTDHIRHDDWQEHRYVVRSFLSDGTQSDSEEFTVWATRGTATPLPAGAAPRLEDFGGTAHLVWGAVADAWFDVLRYGVWIGSTTGNSFALQGPRDGLTLRVNYFSGATTDIAVGSTPPPGPPPTPPTTPPLAPEPGCKQVVIAGDSWANRVTPPVQSFLQPLGWTVSQLDGDYRKLGVEGAVTPDWLPAQAGSNFPRLDDRLVTLADEGCTDPVLVFSAGGNNAREGLGETTLRTVREHLNTILDAISAAHPNVRIVLPGYDLLNLTNSPECALGALVISGEPGSDLDPTRPNLLVFALAQLYEDLASTRANVSHARLLGSLQGQPGQADPARLISVNYMEADCIHVNSDGFGVFGWQLANTIDASLPAGTQPAVDQTRTDPQPVLAPGQLDRRTGTRITASAPPPTVTSADDAYDLTIDYDDLAVLREAEGGFLQDGDEVRLMIIDFSVTIGESGSATASTYPDRYRPGPDGLDNCEAPLPGTPGPCRNGEGLWEDIEPAVGSFRQFIPRLWGIDDFEAGTLPTIHGQVIVALDRDPAGGWDRVGVYAERARTELVNQLNSVLGDLTSIDLVGDPGGLTDALLAAADAIQEASKPDGLFVLDQFLGADIVGYGAIFFLPVAPELAPYLNSALAKFITAPGIAGGAAGNYGFVIDLASGEGHYEMSIDVRLEPLRFVA